MPQSDVSHRTTEGNPRKRRKVSSPSMAPSAASPSDAESQPAGTIIPIAVADAPMQQTTVMEKAPCAHEGKLKALGTDISAMRDLLTCKICLRLHYEPYTLLCGHTFCYSCLSRWMGQAPKPTCPDCRTVIKEEPHPSYVIRELVLVFTGKNELLDDGETVEKHQEYAREEAEAVAQDRANQDPRTGGLFKGVFRRHANRLVAIRDHEDNVWRCPECHHEVEDGWCHACQERVYGDTDDDDHDLWSDDSDSMSEELDHDLELEDEAIFAEGAEHFPFADLEAEDDEEDIDIEDYMRQRDLLHAFGRAEGEYPISTSSSSGDEDEDEDEDENDPEMDSFIVNDDEVEYEGEPTSEDVHEPSVITVADDEDDDDDDAPVVTQQRRARATRTIMIDSDEDEDEDGGDNDGDDDGDSHINSVPMNLTFRRGWRNQTHVVSSDDDQDEEDDEGTQRDEEGTETGDPSEQGSEDEDDGESVQSGVPSSSAAGEGFSPMQHSMRTGYDYYDDENEQDDDDDDGDDNNQGWSEGAARWGRSASASASASASSSSSGVHNHDENHFGAHWRRSADLLRRVAPEHPFQLENVLANVNRGVQSGREPRMHALNLLPRAAAGREVFWSLEEENSDSYAESDSSETVRGQDDGELKTDSDDAERM